MRLLRLGSAALFAAAITAPSAAAAQEVRIDGREITLRGCVAAPTAELRMPFDTLLWSRGGILTAGTAVADGASDRAAADLAMRVLYWMDEDEFADHQGRLVEVRGELGDLRTGELEIDRDDDFTEIRLEVGGNEEEIRVPTSWLRPGDREDDDVELEIATREVDVEDVKDLGPCVR